MILSSLIALYQLIDAYIRFLPFENIVSEELKRRLFLESLIWSVASIFLYLFLFKVLGINATTHKFIVMLGWLPYFLIFLRKISGLLQHIFVLGMGVIYSLVQHTISAMIILELDLSGNYEIILMEAEVYLMLFAIFFPIYRRYFRNLLPSREFFELRPVGIYIAILPLIISSAHLIRLADNVLVHSDLERLSRLYLPLVFFFFYRYILTAAKSFYDLQRLERNKMHLEDKLQDLQEYNSLIEANRKKISVIRHDLRHNYNIINTLLEAGDVEKALNHIRKQKNDL